MTIVTNAPKLGDYRPKTTSVAAPVKATPSLDQPSTSQLSASEPTVATDAAGETPASLDTLNAHLLAALPPASDDVTTIRCTAWTLAATIGTVRVARLNTIIVCARCGTKAEHRFTGDAKTTSTSCTTCHLMFVFEFPLIHPVSLFCSHTLRYHGALAHAVSNCLGAVQCTNCAPLDVVLTSTALVVSCMQCTRESTIDGLAYGIGHVSWCKTCHAKITLQIDTIRLMGGTRQSQGSTTAMASGQVSHR